MPPRRVKDNTNAPTTIPCVSIRLAEFVGKLGDLPQRLSLYTQMKDHGCGINMSIGTLTFNRDVRPRLQLLLELVGSLRGEYTGLKESVGYCGRCQKLIIAKNSFAAFHSPDRYVTGYASVKTTIEGDINRDGCGPLELCDWLPSFYISADRLITTPPAAGFFCRADLSATSMAQRVSAALTPDLRNCILNRVVYNNSRSQGSRAMVTTLTSTKPKKSCMPKSSR